ncbi:MAG: TIGR02266 family protein [Polyangia bacterium]
MAKLPSLAKDRRASRHQAPLGASHEADPPSVPSSPEQPGHIERRSGADRRQYERVLVDWAVDYRASDTFLFAYISDISAMGIFVRTPNPEPAGTRLNLRFSPPGGQLVELEAQVIWINPPRDDDEENRQPGMGLQFVDLSPAQREQVLRLVRTFAYLPDEEDGEDAEDADSADGGDESAAGVLASAERRRGRKPALC